MKKYLFFIFTFILLVVLPSIYLSNKLEFTNVGDNITYIMQAESLYYDHDFKLEKKDFKRMYAEYPQIVKKLPIISKQDLEGNLTFGKPIFITIYFALFTPIQNPIHRGLAANLLLSLFLYISAYVLIKDKKLFLMFCVLMVFSQFNFYLPEVHPEIFTNAFVLMSALPMLAIFPKKTWIYSVAGAAGGILIFEKQLAIFFPLVTLTYLYFKEQKYFRRYFIFFLTTCLVGLGINYLLHGDAIAYQGLRGLSQFDGKNLVFQPQGVVTPFIYPLTYMERLKDYFFGKIIGIFVYNPGFIIFLFSLLISIFLAGKKRVNLLLFTPPLLYLATYFFAVDPGFSYGGATTIGNRYFFQIYFFVITLALIVIKKENFKKPISTFLVITTIIFSFFIYRPLYRNYSRAIMDHFVIVLNNEKTFGIFPLELSYHQTILSDLVGENKIDDKIFIINNARPVVQQNNDKWLPRGKSMIVEVSENSNLTLPKRLSYQDGRKTKRNYLLKRIKTVTINYVFLKKHYVTLFEVDCSGDLNKCVPILTAF